MSGVDVTLTLVESGVIEEAANEALVDQGFVPAGPLSALPAAYSAGATYPIGALVSEAGQVYRGIDAANKGHEPKADTDFAHWAPVNISFVPLVNPAFGSTSYVSGL